MSDNDFTSGDPWGLSSTGTEEAPPVPPPVPNPVSDELPEDLADLSTIAAPDVAVTAPAPDIDPDIDMDIENPLDSDSDDDDAGDADAYDVASGLDLGDFGNLSDLADDNDLGPLEASDLAGEAEAIADSSADLAVEALADLSSLSADSTEPSTDDETPEGAPSPSAGRPLNPLLAASGLFGGSPSLPPLKDSEPETADTDVSLDAAAPSDTDLSIQVGDGDIDFDAIELSAQSDLGDFELPAGEIDAGEIDAPADIEAELAETLNALGDQPADAITFSPNLPLAEAWDDDETSVKDDSGTSSTEGATEGATEDAENFYPEFTSGADTDESADKDADGADDQPVEIGFGDPDFTTPNPPPAIYHELEDLGGVEDDSEVTGTDDVSDAESVSEFSAIFGDSKTSPDDPFGAVFGSADEAIDAVAAAASSIETTHPTIRVEPVDAPTVDDLPDFLIDDDSTDGSPTDVTEPADGSLDQPVDSAEDDAEATPSAWLGFGDDDDEAIDDDLADYDLYNGDIDNDEVSPAAMAGEFSADDGRADQDSAKQDSADAPLSEASVDPLPPMRDIGPATFDADPFAAPTVADLTKVDSGDLDSAPPPFDIPGPAAATESVAEAVDSDTAFTDAAISDEEHTDPAASPNGPGHVPIIGTVATGVIEKKPIPENWGTRSDDAYEGWVQDDEGVETWRMIITNLPTVAGYDIDEFLGLAVADSLVVSHDVETVASGRRAAIDALTEDGVLRGAHAIVAVTHAVQAMGNHMLVTVSGTAVTLKPTTAAHAD